MSRRHQSRLFERQNRVRLDALARVQDYLEGIKDMRACRAVGKDSAAMEQAMLELKRVTMRVELAVDVSVSLASAILRSGVGLTACVGAVLLASGGVDFMVLLMFLLIVSRVYGPILALVSQLLLALPQNQPNAPLYPAGGAPGSRPGALPHFGRPRYLGPPPRARSTAG